MVLKDSDLKTQADGLTDLWRTLDKQRADAKTVTVDRKALVALLSDHATMAGTLAVMAAMKPLAMALAKEQPKAANAAAALAALSMLGLLGPSRRG